MTRPCFRLLPGFVVFAVLGITEPAFSQSPPILDSQENCIDCHPEYKKQLSAKREHAPFADNKCLTCHRFHGFQNRMQLLGTVTDVCTDCHSKVLEPEEDNQHAPLQEDDGCIICHEPHASDYRRLLITPVPDLCVECHDDPNDAAGVVHPPYAQGRCDDCHNPHGSPFNGFLTVPAGYLCLSCHGDILPSGNPTLMHAAVDLRSCDRCHTGHAAPEESLLRKPVRDLCGSCHEKEAGAANGADAHPAAAEEPCVLCHSAHFLKGASFLVEAERDLCGSCHDVDEADFRLVHAGMNPTVCTECHNPHGSPNANLMREYLHPPFEDGDCAVCHEDADSRETLRSNELCLTCHDPMAGAHATHRGEKRMCVDCHSPHASAEPGLLRSP